MSSPCLWNSGHPFLWVFGQFCARVAKRRSEVLSCLGCTARFPSLNGRRYVHLGFLRILFPFPVTRRRSPLFFFPPSERWTRGNSHDSCVPDWRMDATPLPNSPAIPRRSYAFQSPSFSSPPFFWVGPPSIVRPFLDSLIWPSPIFLQHLNPGCQILATALFISFSCPTYCLLFVPKTSPLLSSGYGTS